MISIDFDVPKWSKDMFLDRMSCCPATPSVFHNTPLLSSLVEISKNRMQWFLGLAIYDFISEAYISLAYGEFFPFPTKYTPLLSS
jgi:hypothetical protein